MQHSHRCQREVLHNVICHPVGILSSKPMLRSYLVTSGNYRATVDLKKRNPSLKVLIAVGGWAEGGKKYSAMAATPQSRSRFVDSVVEFLREHKFDGLDVDWEYPGARDRDGVWADK